MDIFDVIGPVMIGPSSSHTAGAVKIGKIARLLLQQKPVYVKFTLFGSFAYTYKGHGTDKALAAGILGFKPDNLKIPDSLDIAKQEGIDLKFIPSKQKQPHANTVHINAKSNDREVYVKAASTGGGNILITYIDGFNVQAECVLNTLVIPHMDVKGVVAGTAAVLASKDINIAGMKVYRNNRGGDAVMVIETDQPVGGDTLKALNEIPHVIKTVHIPPV